MMLCIVCFRINFRLLVVFLCFMDFKVNCNFSAKGRLSHVKKRFEEYSSGRSNPPVVETAKGKIAGKRVDLDNDDLPAVFQYLGVPYAKPPVENLRWKKPVEHGVWQGIWNATKFKPVCPQTSEKGLAKGLLPVWYDFEKEYLLKQQMSEDCLYLNIYVPAIAFNFQEANLKARKLPVMVFIHGHTFSEGSGNFYDASVLASFGGVIVVTFNYRLGILGFLSTENQDSPGNYGLWDQIEALKWISMNIEHFGGDPEKITVFGSGSGAASIGILMLSISTEGSQSGNVSRAWFKQSILQSGFSTSPWSIARNSRLKVSKLAENPQINCLNNFTKDMMNCLRQISWENIMKIPFEANPYEVVFGPVVDGNDSIFQENDGLLKNFPKTLFKRGEFTDYTIIVGVNQNDGCSGLMEDLKPENKISSNNDKTFEFASQALFDENDLDESLSSLIFSYFGSMKNSSADFVKEILKFLYTDWPTYHKINSITLKRMLMDIYTDSQFVEPVTSKLNFHLEHNHPAYFYTFNHHADAKANRSWIGSAIGDEIPYVFGAPFFRNKSPMFPYEFTADDKSLSSAMMTFWTNFAKTGSPTPSSSPYLFQQNRGFFKHIKWPRYDHNTRLHMHLSSQPRVLSHYRARNTELWSQLLPKLLKIEDLSIQEEIVLKKEVSTSEPARHFHYVHYRPQLSQSNTSVTTSEKTTQANTNEGSVMNVQLSMTLAVGFVLLFVNIIAFAIISYRKEQDKIIIQKLQSDLRRYKRKDSKRRSKTQRHPICSSAVGPNAMHNETVADLRSVTMQNQVNCCSTYQEKCVGFMPPTILKNQRLVLSSVVGVTANNTLSPMVPLSKAIVNPQNTLSPEGLLWDGSKISSDNLVQISSCGTTSSHDGAFFENPCLYHVKPKQMMLENGSKVLQLSSFSTSENDSFENKNESQNTSSKSFDKREENHNKSSMDVYSLPETDYFKNIHDFGSTVHLLPQDRAKSAENNIEAFSNDSKRCFGRFPLRNTMSRYKSCDQEHYCTNQHVNSNSAEKIHVLPIVPTKCASYPCAEPMANGSDQIESPFRTFSTTVTKL